MKLFLKFAGAFTLLLGSVNLLKAANTCVPTDMFCYQSGPSQSLTTLGRMDSSGNLTIAGNETVSGSNTVTGNNTITGNSAVVGKNIYTRTTQTGVTISSAISNSAPFVVIVTTSPNATIVTTATPTISTSTATDGQYIVIKGTSSVSTYTFVDQGTLSGSLLELGASTRIVSDSKVLTLIFDSLIGKWLEVSYANN